MEYPNRKIRLLEIIRSELKSDKSTQTDDIHSHQLILHQRAEIRNLKAKLRDVSFELELAEDDIRLLSMFPE